MKLREQVTLACMAEVIATKPGNVHRGADFDETTFGDFAVSSIVIADAIANARSGVGRAVLDAVTKTHRYVGQNTNLGIVLLLAPLAAVPDESSCEMGVQQVLDNLTAEDAKLVYEAIRVAIPGHLGQAKKWDVHEAAPPLDLVLAMREAADRDNVAKQFVTGFQDVFTIAHWLTRNDGLTQNDGLTKNDDRRTLSERIVRAHVRAMATWPDTLIARKCGRETAEQASHYARRAVEAEDQNEDQNEADGDRYWQLVGDLDFWLRSDGHRRNPGTTADLVCAAVFVALREDRIQPPFF